MSEEKKPDNQSVPETPVISETEKNDKAAFDDLANEYEQSQIEPETEGQIVEVSTKDILAPIIYTAFLILCPNWNVKEKESGQLALVWGAVLDKHFPDGVMNEFGLEIAAFSTTVMIVLPRLKTERKKPDTIPEKPVEETEKPKSEFGNLTDEI